MRWKQGDAKPLPESPNLIAWCTWTREDGSTWGAWFDPAELVKVEAS